VKPKFSPKPAPPARKKRDVFIAHATEDKPYVDPLVRELEAAGITVWYDRTSLEWGDDLRRSIDKGLVNCRYGIVVLSKAFLAKKKWTEYELSSLFAREESRQTLILPIWHGTTHDDLVRYSPGLADRLAKISGKDSYSDIVASMLAKLGRSARQHRDVTRPTETAMAEPGGARPNAIVYAGYEAKGGSGYGTITTFRNPIASIWQHAIHKAISQIKPGEKLYLSATQPEMTQFNAALDALQKGKPIPATDDFDNVIGNCAKLAAEYVWAEITRDTLRASELEDELRDSKCDPLWAIALAIYLAWKASLHPIPYVRYSSLNDFVIPLPDKPDLVIGVIADWGTGLDDAKWLLSEVMKRNPDVLLHLGGVYYAGTAREFSGNFLDPINAIAPNIPVYTLSGNHDMYAGGAPFYWALSQLNATPALQPYQQKASYFCLRSANWQILAMDTGLHDLSPFTVAPNITFLDPKEEVWHVHKLNNAGGRQTILLSHHQLFTAFGHGIGQGRSGKPLAYNPKLYSVFGPFLGNIALWLWGHENNFEVFNPYLGLKKGRCVGASALPCYKAQNPYGLIQNPDLQGQSALPSLAPGVMELGINFYGWYFHNYAILTLRGPNSQFKDSKIEYYEVDSASQGPSILMYGEVIP
jgi:hypothetical protein